MPQTETIISLNHLRFHAYHGVMPQEQRIGGLYDVSLDLNVHVADSALVGDELSGTVNYAEVYDIVNAAMKQPSQLLEHVASRILRAVFLRYRQVVSATVSVSKLNPPISADCHSACVRLTSENPWSDALKLLILDFDGTLADTSAGIVRTMRATFSELQLPQPDTDEAICQTIGLPLIESIARLAPPDMGTAALENALQTYRRLFEHMGRTGTTAFPHVVETLKYLTTQAGIKAAVATSRGHASVEHLCEQVGLAPFISLYVAEDDVAHKKPHPETVSRILAHFNVPATSALVVGDTAYDIQMGRDAGCPTCGVTYGNQSAPQLAKAGADAIIDKFCDLTAFFS